MCLIIDANITGEFFNQNRAAALVLSHLSSGKIDCVSGHKNKQELIRTRFRTLYKALLIAGKIREFQDSMVEENLAKLPRIVSDDPHVLALALTAGARVLYSNDQLLHADFTNPAILSRPKGRVFQDESHKHLLTHKSCVA